MSTDQSTPQAAPKSYLKKMSVKSLGCDPTEARQKEYAPGAMIAGPNDAAGNPTKVPSVKAGKKVPLCVIGGRASGTKSGENRQTGDVWTALTGRFEGVVIQAGDGFKTGEVYESGMVFLPGGIQEAIEGALETAGEGGSVDFAIEITSGYDETSPVGYRYYGRNLKPPSASDDLAAIRAVMQPHVQAFLGPAPATTEPAQIQAAAVEPVIPAPAPPAPAPAANAKPAPAASRKGR